MKIENVFLLPEELQHSFFFSENDTVLIDNQVLLNNELKTPFLYDAAFYLKIETKKPWQMNEEFIPLLLEEWESTKIILEGFFAKRDVKQVLKPLKYGISLLIEFVFWTNERPVQLNQPLEQNNLKIKPVNLEERIDFILARPTLHHSFIQLSELMVEMNKQYVKHIALKKASKQ